MPSSSSSKTVRRYISVVSISPWAVTATLLLTLMLRASATSRWKAAFPLGLRRETLYLPAAPGALVAEAVVQAVAAGLPEFDDVRGDQVAAPEVGHRHLGALGPPLLKVRDPVVELGAGGKDRRLAARPRADLRAALPRVKVRLALLHRQRPGRPLHGHLAAEGVPGEDRAAARVAREVAGLAGGPVRMRGR